MMYAPEGLEAGIAALAGEGVFTAILERAGAPRFRRRRNGFATLLHIILEQQVSIDAAAAMHRRLAGLCQPLAPAGFLALDDDTLRRCGFSRQKMGYARGLAEAVAGGRFDFPALERAPDDEVFAALTSLKGIGRWSAEIYLIFALGRPDVWPAADLGLQLAIGECLGLAERPGEPALREMGAVWQPWRSVAACLFWQSYLHKRRRAAPCCRPNCTRRVNSALSGGAPSVSPGSSPGSPPPPQAGRCNVGSSPAMRGRGTMRSMVEGAARQRRPEADEPSPLFGGSAGKALGLHAGGDDRTGTVASVLAHRIALDQADARALPIVLARGENILIDPTSGSIAASAMPRHSPWAEAVAAASAPAFVQFPGAAHPASNTAAMTQQLLIAGPAKRRDGPPAGRGSPASRPRRRSTRRRSRRPCADSRGTCGSPGP